MASCNEHNQQLTDARLVLGKVRALLLTIEAPASSKQSAIVTKMSDKEREELKKYQDLVQKIGLQDQLKTVELTDKTKKSRQTPFTRKRKSKF
jgi:hypothetical protein